jgi:hypothetical protein
MRKTLLSDGGGKVSPAPAHPGPWVGARVASQHCPTLRPGLGQYIPASRQKTSGGEDFSKEDLLWGLCPQTPRIYRFGARMVSKTVPSLWTPLTSDGGDSSILGGKKTRQQLPPTGGESLNEEMK